MTHLAANPSLPDLIPTLRQLPESTSLERAADELFATQLDLYTRLFHPGRDSDSWNPTEEALATAEKYTAVPGLDLAFALATSIQGGMETSSRQRRGSTTVRPPAARVWAGLTHLPGQENCYRWGLSAGSQLVVGV